MKAFDLDGVFIPDCDLIPNIGGLKDFYKLTYYMRPIFEPEGDYAIITARNKDFESLTMAWINKHFKNPPKTVWHKQGKLSAKEYKAEIINTFNIRIYVESEPSIVEYLQKHTQAQVILFSSWNKLVDKDFNKLYHSNI